jgi:predicted DNA-binding WGR domain protein
METLPQHQIWVHHAKARYYEVHLDRDLLGDWALRKIWGGLGSRRGGTHNTGVASYDDAIEQVREIAKRRIRHGYQDSHPG